MAEKTFLTLGRREGIFKISLNILTILFAAMIASEFFIKFNMTIRLTLATGLLVLMAVAIIACPPRSRDERSL